MCGIWGFLGNSQQIDVTDAWDGLCSLRDRGPNDWGVYTDSHGKITDEAALSDAPVDVFLGNRRLSILDLSKAGNQPMEADGTWIVYNGEVYNYRELRDELRDHGHTFTSDTDTEVVLRSYLEFGPDCVDQFRGMFAFAIWEPTDRTLFAARDRLGIKPFYYTSTDEQFAFASEVTALLKGKIIEPTLDLVAVDGFLALGSVPAPRTILEDVQSLPPGNTLVYDATAEEYEINSYWEPSFDGSTRPLPEDIRQCLKESVRLRLRSDVPVGAFLSGGLDSSTIVALMNELRQEDATKEEDESNILHTYSIGFDEAEYSETDHAEAVADLLGTNHTSKTVTGEDVAAELPNIIAQMDQPTIDGVNTYFVSKLTADDDLRVALSGLGGDELFYGYPSFRYVPLLYRLGTLTKALPSPLRRSSGTILEKVQSLLPTYPLYEMSEVVRTDTPFATAYLAVRGLFPISARRKLLDNVETEWDGESAIEDTVTETLVSNGPNEAVSYAELRWYMHNQLLRDTDVMSMAHSLEVRVPFLDQQLVEFLAGTASNSKGERTGTKELLKGGVRGTVPDHVLDREKTGFEFPFAEWLEDDLRPVVDHALTDAQLAQTPLDPEAVSTVEKQFDAGNLHWSRLWAPVVLSLWIDEHINQ